MGVRSNTRAILKLTNCTFTYPGRTTPSLINVSCALSLSRWVLIMVIVDFSFTVNSRVGVVGPNGAGKSTLIKLLTVSTKWHFLLFLVSDLISPGRDGSTGWNRLQTPQSAGRLCLSTCNPSHRYIPSFVPSITLNLCTLRTAPGKDRYRLYPVALPRWT